MKHKILVVDDDQGMLLFLKNGIEQYDDSLSVLLAGDGILALEKMKEHTVSLVVSDLKMPRMDGFSLMAQMKEYYPGIPVIIITKYGTGEMEREARQLGAVAYIQKPFVIRELTDYIKKIIDDLSDGGRLHNVSSGMFLQLVEMEKRTCTIRMKHSTTGKQGVLFFREGVLFDARIGNLIAEPAAYEMFSWEEVSLAIQNTCPVVERQVKSDLQGILLESMRLKDEREYEKIKAAEKEKAKKSNPPARQKANGVDALSQQGITDKITQALGEKNGLEDVYPDASWDGLMAELAGLGEHFSFGELKAAYVNNNQNRDLIILPGPNTIVAAVNPKCSRDFLLEIMAKGF